MEPEPEPKRRLGLSRDPRHVRRRLILILSAGIVAIVAAGLLLQSGGDEDDPAPARNIPPASGDEEPRSRTSFLARLIPAPREEAVEGPTAPRSIRDLARRLPVDRKVAQMFLFGFGGTELTIPVFDQLRRLDLGGVVIEERNYETPQQLASLAGEFGVVAREVRHVPPFVMAAQEGGDFNEFPDLPPARAPSEIQTAEEAAVEATQAAATLRPLGISGIIGPVIDVGLEDGGVIGERAYSDDPAEVSAFARATVAAYNRARTFSAVKHFPGLGGANQSTDEGPASVGLSVEELGRRDLVPFLAAVRARAPGIVVGNASYATDDFVTPASLSKPLLTDLLRGRLGFRGVAITDDLAAPAVTSFAPVPDAAVESVKAGADLVFVSGPRSEQEAAYNAVLNAVRKRDISRRRVDEAVLRILIAKQRYGLIER
jgi:beta-N-acetylhexosaminidase